MASNTYHELLTRARAELTAEERVNFARELAMSNAAPRPKRSLLELEGLGSEVWKGIDVDKYIEEERNSWD